VPGSGEHACGRAGLDHLAFRHHHHAVGPLRREAEIVRHQQQRGAELAGQPVQPVEDLPLHGDVERRGRLVRDQQVRPAGEADREQRPLAHPAGELVRVLPRPPRGFRQPHLAQQLDRSARRPPSRGHAVHHQGFRDLTADP
jgi:hypothetical protein